MIRIVALLLCVFAAAEAQSPLTLDQILSRVSEEASVLEQNAPKALTQETLEQRARMGPSRFHPRVGKAATEAPKLRLRVREIVSEYSVGPLKESESRNLLEFRQVISVDGRKIQSAESARHALSLGVHSPDDRIRKRMLEDFARYGLVDIATDYGMILLAFTKRGLEHVELTLGGEERVGTDDALVLKWRQTSEESGELEFHGKQATRLALAGSLWVRKSDGLPMRVSAWAEHVDAAKHRVRDEATVEYAMSPHGFLTPLSVVHRHLLDGQLITENLYRYEPFKLFAADSDIKFTAVPDPSTLSQPPEAPKKK
jgi:hypothetical protein